MEVTKDRLPHSMPGKAVPFMISNDADSNARQTLEPLFAAREPDDLSSAAYRQLIGYLGLLLPFILWLAAGLRPTEGLPPWKVLESVSSYYHTGAVAAFVGVLAALGAFLVTYRGYKNESRWRDRVAGVVAGIAAVLVAFFPTAVPTGLPELSWWTKLTGTVHYTAAATLFCSFIFFSLFQFRKSKRGSGKTLPTSKRLRNGVHLFCGIAMAVCIAWAGIASVMGAPMFWPEALALEFFAASWLTKGYADRTLIAAAGRTIYYGRHPGQLAGDILGAVRSLRSVSQS